VNGGDIGAKKETSREKPIDQFSDKSCLGARKRLSAGTVQFLFHYLLPYSQNTRSQPGNDQAVT
jgi:hypothetical protein